MAPKSRGRGGGKKQGKQNKGKNIAKKQPDVPPGKKIKGEFRESSSDDEDLQLDATQVIKTRRKSKSKRVQKSPPPGERSPKSPSPPPAKDVREGEEETQVLAGEDDQSDDSTLEQEPGTQDTRGEIYLH